MVRVSGVAQPISKKIEGEDSDNYASHRQHQPRIECDDIDVLRLVQQHAPTRHRRAQPETEKPDGTVTIITGYGAGGGYSAYSQVIAKYLGRHIPGNPAVIAQNMPGGGSIIAVNYIYNVSKPDGLTIGSVNACSSRRTSFAVGCRHSKISRNWPSRLAEPAT